MPALHFVSIGSLKHLMPATARCRRGSIGQHSLLAQLTDDEPAVVAELVALVTELKAEGGVAEVRDLGLSRQGLHRGRALAGVMG